MELLKKSNEAGGTNLDIRDHVTELMERKGIRSKEAIREVANERGLSRREVYKEYHVEDE